jgi:hypothetical protein
MPDIGWQNFEVEVAELLGLDPTCHSGSTWHDKGDAVSRGRNSLFPLFAECKYTEKISFTLGLLPLNNYAEQAAQVGKRFILPLRFWPRGASRPTDFVVLSLHDFKELVDGYAP